MDALYSPDGFTPRKKSRLSLSRLKREKRLKEQEQSEHNNLEESLGVDVNSLESVAGAKSTVDERECFGRNIESGIDVGSFDSPEKQALDDDNDDLNINMQIDDSSSSSEDEGQFESEEGFQHVGNKMHGSEKVMLDDDSSSSDSDDSVKPSRSNSLKRKRIVIDDDDERDNESVPYQMNSSLHSKYAQSSLLLSPTKSESDDNYDSLYHHSTESFGLAQHTASPLQSPINEDIDDGNEFQKIVQRNFSYSEGKEKPDKPPSSVREGLRTPSCQMKNRSIYRKQSPIETDDIESSCESSDDDDGSDDDDLVILSPKKQSAKNKKREVICLDSDEESEDGKPYASERNSFLPSWGSGSKSFSANKVKENTSSSAITILNGKNRSQKVKKSKASHSTATSTRRLTRASTNTSEADSGTSSFFERRDIIGGSGLGLGGFQVQRSDDYDEENQENGSTKGRTTGGRRKTAKKKTSSSKTKADFATKKKARKTKGRKTKKAGRRNYRSRKRSGSDAWSANDRGISNYRGRGRGRGRGGGSRVTNPQPYMSIAKADPIGNTGGASITF